MDKTLFLLVEDDEADALLVQRALRGSSIRHELTRVTSLREGLNCLRTRPVSIVLTDLGLPDCSGLEAVASLRAMTEEATIIVLSGLEDCETQLEALDHGAQDYLIKSEISPFTLERAIEHGTHRLKNERKVRTLFNSVSTQKSELERQAKLLDQKNRRLRKLCKTAQQCVNNVSHDFRTPLTVVKEYASLIADGIVGEVQPEQARMLRVMGDRVDDLNNMVDDMLDVSRHNSGLLGANRVACDVDDVITRLLPGLHQKASLRNLTLETRLADDLPKVFCDAEKVGRVVVNLIINAIKFTEPNGRILVSADSCPGEGQVRISIADTGHGISPDDCRAIFRRFQQVKSGVQNTAKGFGLGLSIAKELVDLNLGEISVESSLGDGSTFSFTIPVNEPAEVAKRYLKRLRQLSGGKAHVSVIHAGIDATSEKEQSDARQFLVTMHRSRDLLLDIGPSQWMLLLCGRQDRVPEFFARAEEERQSLNRNRPSGPLPAVGFEHLGTYRTSKRGAEIMRIVQETADAEEVPCV